MRTYQLTIKSGLTGVTYYKLVENVSAAEAIAIGLEEANNSNGKLITTTDVTRYISWTKS